MLHSGARGNLLSSIQGGGQKLKKTETRDCSAPELTDAIQQELMAGGSENYYLDLSRPREVAAVRGGPELPDRVITAVAGGRALSREVMINLERNPALADLMGSIAAVSLRERAQAKRLIHPLADPVGRHERAHGQFA